MVHKNIIKIIIIILLLILLYILFILEPYDNKPYYKYQDIRKKLKTGDIILFSCKKHGSIVEKITYAGRTNLLNSEYGHAAIVIKKNNKLYALECCGYDQCGFKQSKYLNKLKTGRGGVRIIDLDFLLKEYYKEYQGTYAVKFISEKIPNNVISHLLKKYKNIKFQDRNTLIMLAVIDVGISHKLAEYLVDKYGNDKMICTEFLHDFLFNCNILDKYPSKLFWPHLITNDIFKKLEKIKYSKPCKFMIENNNKY